MCVYSYVCVCGCVFLVWVWVCVCVLDYIKVLVVLSLQSNTHICVEESHILSAVWVHRGECVCAWVCVCV